MYSNHSKFVYTNKDKIQDAINQGILNENDIVICENTCEMIVIQSDLSMMGIHSRVRRYTDYNTAISNINSSNTSYSGEIIAILNAKSGKYEAYIINQSANGRFIIDPFSVSVGTVTSYDSLGNRPIENLYGNDPASPIILETLSDGIYCVNGNYKIANSIETIFSSASNNLFIVSHENGSTLIKKIGTDITDYTINEFGDISSTSVVTAQFLEDQDYVTNTILDTKLAALDCITRNEAKEYIAQMINETVNTLVSNAIDKELENKFQDCTESELVNLFH